MDPMLRRSALVGLLALSALPLAAQARRSTPAQDRWTVLDRPNTRRPTPTTGAITTNDLMSRLYRFSADSMQGRFMGSEGNYKGAEYIAAELRRLGLEPAGENGTYFQTLPWMERGIDSSATLNAGGRAFAVWTDFVARDQGLGQRSIDGVPVVYGGDLADTANRISPEAAAGKVVVLTFSGTVPGNSPGIPNRGTVNQRYPAAAGLLIVGLEALTPSDLAGFRQTSRFLQRDGTPTPLPSYLYISRPMAEALLGAPLAGLRAGAAGTPLRGNPAYWTRPSRVPARNVVAILRGSDPALRNSYVAIGAHNDHIGMGQPVAFDSQYVVNHLYRLQGADDAPPRLTPEQQAEVNAILARLRARNGGASARVDSIYNGADDDGSGSMGVLEIAERYATMRERPKRSILFVWHVGEELGLFGSQYFTDHPTVPRDSIIAQLNVDMIGRGGADDVTGVTLAGDKIRGNPNYLQLIGSRRISTQLGDLAETENREGHHGLAFDYSLDANGHPQNIYCRSDHYEYARYSIPIIFFTTGGHADYHQVTDEPQFIDYTHYGRVARYIAALGLRVANLTERPSIDHPVADPNGRCQQ